MKPKILITGFQPFDGAKTNPSWEAAKRVQKAGSPFAEIICREIPVMWHEGEIYKSTWQAIQDEVKWIQPDCLISIGQGPSNTIECTGINKAIVYHDNEHKYYNGENGEKPLETDKPMSFSIPATLPCNWLLENFPFGESNIARLNRSDDAGGYLCNIALYMPLIHLNQIAYSGFFHTNETDESINGVVLAIQMIAERLYGQSA